MTTPDASVVRERRATVKRHADEGKSLREIAALVGVSKDTVSRDLAVARQTSTADRTDRTTGTGVPAVPETGTGVPETVAVPLTAEVRADLDVLAQAGHPTPEASVTAALEFLANIHRRDGLRRRKYGGPPVIVQHYQPLAHGEARRA